jgi:integrase
MLGDLRKLLDRVARRAGLRTGEFQGLRTRLLRRPAANARPGAPAWTYTVARELGHESEAMVRKAYAHLGTIRHRSEAWSIGSSSTANASAIGSCGWGW